MIKLGLKKIISTALIILFLYVYLTKFFGTYSIKKYEGDGKIRQSGFNVLNSGYEVSFGQFSLSDKFSAVYRIGKLPANFISDTYFLVRVLSKELPLKGKLDAHIKLCMIDDNGNILIQCETTLKNMKETGPLSSSENKNFVNELIEKHFYSISNIVSISGQLTRCNLKLRSDTVQKIKPKSRIEFSYDPIGAGIDGFGELFLSQGGSY